VAAAVLIYYTVAPVVGTALLQYLIVLKECITDTKLLAIQIIGSTIARKQHLVLQALVMEHVQITSKHTVALTVHVGGWVILSVLTVLEVMNAVAQLHGHLVATQVATQHVQVKDLTSMYHYLLKTLAVAAIVDFIIVLQLHTTVTIAGAVLV
jgi:hypothetical protein